MQARNATTIHCVHGTSHGWNFAGYSDIGLFVCGHDARLAQQFPGYRLATHLSLTAPAPVSGDQRWVLMTSYTHPMNPAYVSSGIEADLHCLNAVARAASAVGQQPKDIVWKPHPAIHAVAPAHAAALHAHARTLGFQPWPAGDGLDRLREFGVVVTTPSTAAIDALAHGKAPIVICANHPQADVIYARIPLIAECAADLVAAIRSVKFDQAATHAATWAALQPGGSITAEGVMGTLRQLPPFIGEANGDVQESLATATPLTSGIAAEDKANPHPTSALPKQQFCILTPRTKGVPP